MGKQTSTPETSSPETRYRVAVVGAAGSWGRHYLHTYASHPRCELVAIVDRAADRARTFADHYGVPAVFDDVAELLEREVPDVVSVIPPVGISHQVVVSCAEAGWACPVASSVRLSIQGKAVPVRCLSPGSPVRSGYRIQSACSFRAGARLLPLCVPISCASPGRRTGSCP